MFVENMIPGPESDDRETLLLSGIFQLHIQMCSQTELMNSLSHSN